MRSAGAESSRPTGWRGLLGRADAAIVAFDDRERALVNPALRKDGALARLREAGVSATMTLEGTAVKTLALLGLAVATAGLTHSLHAGGYAIGGLTALGIFGGLGVALLTTFVPRRAPVTAPIYAALEGLAAGGISVALIGPYGAIPMQAVVLTAGVCLTMLMAYRSRLIRVTRPFLLTVVSATGGIAVLYLAAVVLGLFGMSVNLLDMGGWSVIVSLVVVTVAALNLVLDFAFIDEQVKEGAPKYFEWYAGFGLLVTLVWLYVEIVRLLVILTPGDE